MSAGALGRTAIVLLIGQITVAPADRQLRTEHYSRIAGDDVIRQFWTFDGKRRGAPLRDGVALTKRRDQAIRRTGRNRAIYGLGQAPER
jgi:hypothetical protein